MKERRAGEDSVDQSFFRGRQALGRFLRDRREALKLTREQLSDRLQAQGLELCSSTLTRLEGGETALLFEQASILGRCLGITVPTMQEVFRSARMREKIDLSNWTFDGLLEEGKRRVSYGDFHGALDHFQALHDWVRLHPEAANKPNFWPGR